MTKHAETPCGEEDSKAQARPYAPEIDDLIKIEEESKWGLNYKQEKSLVLIAVGLIKTQVTLQK
jgi:hypothetical protein